MKKIGIIADVHADADALRAALKLMSQFECDLVVCAGDILDYGPDPDEAAAILHEHKIPCVRGNHDFMDIGADTASAYSAALIKYVDALPYGWNETIEGVRVALRHGTAKDLNDSIYPDSEDKSDFRADLIAAGIAPVQVLIVGHSHLPFCISGTTEEGKDGLIVNPGALLRSQSILPQQDGSTATVLFDSRSKRMLKVPRETKATHAGGTFGIIEMPSLAFRVYGLDGLEIEIIKRSTDDVRHE